MDMDLILDEVRRDVFERPKSTIDLDLLYSLKNDLQKFADDTNSQLKKNVYQNYSLFIDSSREISTLKEEMRQLNTLLEQQQTSMNKLLDQLNKTPIIQTTIERPEPRRDIFGNLDDITATDDEQAEMLPEWFVKSPEDFDVLIAQRNLREAVELVKKIREHFVQYPKCCEKQVDLKNRIENGKQELINMICSELQPATDRSVQGGPRSSIHSIQLLRELNLTSRAVKLYLDLRSSILRFVLEQQKVESTTTIQFIKQICSIFFHNTTETCNEFKQAFEVDKYIHKAIVECDYLSDIDSGIDQSTTNSRQLFGLVRSIYQSQHPKFDKKLAAYSNGNDISSQILSSHGVKVPEETLAVTRSTSGYKTFNYLSTYSSLTYWINLEFEYFSTLFRDYVFNNSKLSISMIAESIHHLRTQCSRMAAYCEIDMSQFIERELKNEIRQVIEESGKTLVETIKRLDSEERWKPQEFKSKAEKTRFIEEMEDVGLKTMSKYITDDFKLVFTASKTAFAHCFLLMVQDLAKLATTSNKNHVDSVLAKTFEIQIESVIEALKRADLKKYEAREIRGNSNFLLDKVIVVACERYKHITNEDCQKLVACREKYRAKADSILPQSKLQDM